MDLLINREARAQKYVKNPPTDESTEPSLPNLIYLSRSVLTSSNGVFEPYDRKDRTFNSDSD